MVNYHGYGVVDIVQNVADTKFTLVKCLNTWGRDGEWKGDWSDGSSLWKESSRSRKNHPEVAKALNAESKNDGIFWIDIKDFHQAFCLYWVATLISEDDNENSLDPDQPENTPISEEEGEEGKFLDDVQPETTSYKSESIGDS